MADGSIPSLVYGLIALVFGYVVFKTSNQSNSPNLNVEAPMKRNLILTVSNFLSNSAINLFCTSLGGMQT
ncbi:hypothetical protein ACCE111639_11420 [Acinetobacter celticus]